MSTEFRGDPGLQVPTTAAAFIAMAPMREALMATLLLMMPTALCFISYSPASVFSRPAATTQPYFLLRALPTRTRAAARESTVSAEASADGSAAAGVGGDLGSPSLVGAVISRVAEEGLKLKLASHGDVNVVVDATAGQLLGGKLQSVTVQGTRWASPKQLTCESLHVLVRNAAIDLQRLLQRQQIGLPSPATGEACITFTSTDWTNFLMHPLVTAVTPLVEYPPGSRNAFRFLPQGKVQGEEVWFAGTFRGRTFRLSLRAVNDERSDPTGRPWAGKDGAGRRVAAQVKVEPLPLAARQAPPDLVATWEEEAGVFARVIVNAMCLCIVW